MTTPRRDDTHPPRTLALVFGALLASAGSLWAQADGDKPVREFFSAHCTECHGDEVKKKGLRLDTLPITFNDRTVRDRWAPAPTACAPAVHVAGPPRPRLRRALALVSPLRPPRPARLPASPPPPSPPSHHPPAPDLRARRRRKATQISTQAPSDRDRHG